MKMSLILIAVLIAAILVLYRFASRGRAANRELAAGETEIRDIVREVYGNNITNEQMLQSGSDKVLVVTLQNEKLKELRINLSSLARKRKEGGSLQALKASLRFD
jgi:biopolymer transport protein ExbB/TolQ